jgi:hypothetical protein
MPSKGAARWFAVLVERLGRVPRPNLTLRCLASMTKELRPLSREHKGEREDPAARGARW